MKTVLRNVWKTLISISVPPSFGANKRVLRVRARPEFRMKVSCVFRTLIQQTGRRMNNRQVTFLKKRRPRERFSLNRRPSGNQPSSDAQTPVNPSLLNALGGGQARPGQSQSARQDPPKGLTNFFDVGKHYRLVDMPGLRFRCPFSSDGDLGDRGRR